MRTSPRSREKLGFGFGQDLYVSAAPLTSQISGSTSPHHIVAKTPISNTRGARISNLSSAVSSRAASETASEIIVQADDEMDVDSTSQPASTPQAGNGSHVDVAMTEASPVVLSHPSLLLNRQESFESPMPHLSDQSELSSLPSSSRSSKATTPVDVEGIRDPLMPPTVPSPPRQMPRRTFDVKPKSSLPADIDEQLYAGQCIEAAESCRLDPFSLHREEYHMLRQHITHAQVTTYLNIRNSILRLWINDTRSPVSRKQAVGCAGSRWFDVASICYDWLVRRGFINFGCVRFPAASPSIAQNGSEAKQKTIVVIGAGMSGLGCARQLKGLGDQYADRFRGRGELPPRVIVLEGRARVGGRVYSRQFKSNLPRSVPGYDGERHTAEMGGMIITGFERGNPVNILLRGQLGLDYRALRSETTIYDSNGRPVDFNRDLLVEKLYNDCLDRVSEYKHKTQPSKLIRGNQDLIEHARDSNTDGNKTISQAEEAAAALPHALPVSQQNVPESVNLVPVSSDKVTGRVHTEPGTPATQKASDKAKAMGWKLKNNIAADATIDLSQAAAEQGATLGSVLDEAIMQYRNLVDLTAQDHRLINWHIANLEYSNATNLHNLSLPSWDIDAGNEWDGKHTMVVGGYQNVPRGLAACPTPLDLRTKSPVSKITYRAADGSNNNAVVECEDGTRVEADFVVSTIPLGVLKQPGSVAFDPPLPQWKQDVIERMGFGVLNKVILVYKQAFWDTNRNIFGVLRDASNRHSLNQSDYAASRGRFFQWFNVSDTTGLPCLVALMAGDAGFHTERESNDMLVEEATDVLRKVFGRSVPPPLEAVVTRWQSDRFARGSYSSSGPNMHPDDYNDMAKPIGNLYFAGEHTIGTHPATVHGAYLSGLRAASEIFDAMLGPIDIPTPLVLPKDNTSSLKRKMEEQRDPEQARVDEYEIAVWDYISSKIGPRPLAPSKVASNAYLLYNKAIYETAKRRCEEERSGKKKVGPNDVRVMTSKMWKAATPEDRKPYEDEATRLKEDHAKAVQEFNELSAKWDRDYVTLRAEYERDHPFVAADAGAMANGYKYRRTSKMVTYAESDGSDADF